MEVILNQENLKQALKRVKANKGAPGVDGISVSELPDHLKRQWPELRSNLLAGRYKPQPVRRVDIPKPGGGTRQLGIPTVMDRFIQQAVMQVLQSQWDPTFSESSYGFRVGRSAHQAVKRAKRYVEEGQHWVVDIDLEKFFDRVNHDVLMRRVAKRITDKRVLKLMRAFLNAGIMQAGLVSLQMEGTPQGGLLSPLLSNVLLDELDRELEKRGLKHVRYADDSNIYVRSKRAGKRVKESITHWLENRLKLKVKVNERKSAVSPPGERKFLGYSISPGKGRAWILIAPESIRRAKSRRREITGRSKGRSLEQVIGKLRVYLTGWRNYYSLNELPSLTRNLLGWIRRRLRSLLWKQWKKGRTRYSELRVRGVSKDLAAQTVGSSHKQWRISLPPALCIALPNRLFREMGRPDI
ncbi:group II intron reverse transcriptase/maturase [Serratia symbiotica]|uniref:group II intron reverse transcriptase/maturase n=3 Tax=Serratia symbiotica TaxID=138074 RepID=UPI002090A163|nr:group II intron reverse transcriptase/maturase [Serratia symbiotica]USS95095.1 group II intron reverse transcriptase/maturase [Serratia symbiotica]